MIPRGYEYGLFACTLELCYSVQPLSTPKPLSKGKFNTSIFLFFFYCIYLLYLDQLHAAAFVKSDSLAGAPLYQDSSVTLREEIACGIYLCNLRLQN